ncbi:helix-turn-helix domain-containing protein [Mixta hanseatica]|uniref:helix-turn-helix domain-containing protein n=1 Tax=Mixta hanseatica TaxID=2872648 RepID=UPI00201E5F5C|nr:helix-turn-helix domain-containing protein [Mixta hanseatica]
MLAGQGFYSEIEKHLSCLLYELINYFAAEMKAPRWPKGERLIAEALGVAPEQIWPSRYR